MIGGSDSIREKEGSGGKRAHLNLSETALLIADFVNARTKTTSCDIAEKFAIDRKSASQYLRRLWLGGYIGKRARGLFEPASSSEPSEDTDDNEHTEDCVDTVGSDNTEDTERVEDSHDTEDNKAAYIAQSDDIEDSGDTEQSDEYDDTGDNEDSEEASAAAGLTSGLHAAAARHDGPRVSREGRCPDCGSELGKATGKCLPCILDRARSRADQSGDSVVRNQTAACW